MKVLTRLIPIVTCILLFGCQGNNSTTTAETETSTPAPEVSEFKSPFSKTLEMNGLNFTVSTPNGQGNNFLIIQPKGLALGDQAAQNQIKGRVLDAHIVDMDGDEWPEIIVITKETTIRKGEFVVAYTIENGEKMSELYFPSVLNDTYYSNGYLGQDEINVVGNYLIQRFPVYKTNDAKGNPTGGTRQLQYGLIEKEGKKQLDVVSVTEQKE